MEVTVMRMRRLRDLFSLVDWSSIRVYQVRKVYKVERILDSLCKTESQYKAPICRGFSLRHLLRYTSAKKQPAFLGFAFWPLTFNDTKPTSHNDTFFYCTLCEINYMVYERMDKKMVGADWAWIYYRRRRR